MTTDNQIPTTPAAREYLQALETQTLDGIDALQRLNRNQYLTDLDHVADVALLTNNYLTMHEQALKLIRCVDKLIIAVERAAATRIG